MASPFPTRLDEYCKYFDICVLDLKLPCVFCRCILPVSEAVEYHEKTLAILWRKRVPYMACRCCLKKLAKLEREKFYEGTVRACNLNGSSVTPLAGIHVRCNLCFRLLDISDKADLCVNNAEVFTVRGWFRAPCRSCRNEGQ